MVPLVALLCFSLVGMGCLFWVDNEWVYIKSGGTEDAGQAELFDLPLADGLDHEEIKALDPDGDGVTHVLRAAFRYYIYDDRAEI